MENGICGEIEKKDVMALYFDKIKNISEYNNATQVNKVSYSKQGKLLQTFDLKKYSPIDFRNNQNILKRVYMENILPSMETTDNIKLQIMNDVVDKI
jgi:hypothetical protein